MDNIGEWKLKKYARAIASAQSKEKEWQTLESCSEKPLFLLVMKNGLLKVQMDKIFLEYWNLLDTRDIRTFVKGHCMVFLCKAQDLVRKWRIQFDGGSAAAEQCLQCYKVVSSFLKPTTLSDPVKPIQNVPSASGVDSETPVASTSGACSAFSLTGAVGSQVSPAFPMTDGNVGAESEAQTSHPVHAKRARTSKKNRSCPHGADSNKDCSACKTAMPSALELSKMPQLESMVMNILQDPDLPELVDAVHRIIANM